MTLESSLELRLKVHLSPQFFFFAKLNLLVIRSIWVQKIFEFA